MTYVTWYMTVSQPYQRCWVQSKPVKQDVESEWLFAKLHSIWGIHQSQPGHALELGGSDSLFQRVSTYMCVCMSFKIMKPHFHPQDHSSHASQPTPHFKRSQKRKPSDDTWHVRLQKHNQKSGLIYKKKVDKLVVNWQVLYTPWPALLPIKIHWYQTSQIKCKLRKQRQTGPFDAPDDLPSVWTVTGWCFKPPNKHQTDRMTLVNRRVYCTLLSFE